MSIMGRDTCDKERVSFNLAKLKKGGENFEIAVDPDLAIALKNGKDIDIKEVVKSEKIFSNVKQGVFAPETKFDEVFGTTDILEIAKKIIKEGDIQLTGEYRQKLVEEKKKKIINIIARNGIDPRTKLPHPPQRIENALAEAKVKIDELRPADEQVDRIVTAIRPILPINFEKKKIQVIVPAEFAGKSYSVISQFGKPMNEKWNNDGSLECVIEIPGGIEADFYDKLNAFSHGAIETKVMEK